MQNEIKNNAHLSFAWQKLGVVVYDVFLVSFFSYLCIFFIESIRSGFVVAYVKVDYLLAVCALTGFASLFFEASKRACSNVRMTILCLFIAALISFGIYGYVEKTSGFAAFFALASGLIVFFSCYLMLYVEKEPTSATRN